MILNKALSIIIGVICCMGAIGNYTVTAANVATVANAEINDLISTSSYISIYNITTSLSFSGNTAAGLCTVNCIPEVTRVYIAMSLQRSTGSGWENYGDSYGEILNGSYVTSSHNWSNVPSGLYRVNVSIRPYIGILIMEYAFHTSAQVNH